MKVRLPLPRFRRFTSERQEPETARFYPASIVPLGQKDSAFGWFSFAPPRWWPTGPHGPRGLWLLSVIARLRLLLQPRLRRALADEEPVYLGADWRDLPFLAPAAVPLAWVPDFGAFSTVAGLCGQGHETYVRILHAAHLRDEVGGERRCRWAEFKEGRLQEPGWRPDRLPDGTIDREWASADGRELATLDEGEIPDPERIFVGDILIDDLRRRGFKGNVVQAWWDGWGGSRLAEATPVRVHQPGRELIPFVIELPSFLALTMLENRTPALVFPEDGAWVLANDVDLASTYLGCSRALAERFLRDSQLEVQVVIPDDPLG